SIGQIVHGYAVGFGAEPGVPGAFLHVGETGVPASASPSPAGGGASGGGTGDGGGTVSAPTAFGNYQAVFRLAGAPSVAATIDAVRGGTARRIELRPERFERFRYDDLSFLKIPSVWIRAMQ